MSDENYSVSILVLERFIASTTKLCKKFVVFMENRFADYSRGNLICGRAPVTGVY